MRLDFSPALYPYILTVKCFNYGILQIIYNEYMLMLVQHTKSSLTKPSVLHMDSGKKKILRSGASMRLN